MEDRAKKRREYLRKKVTANTLRVIGVAITIPFGCWFGLSLIVSVVGIVQSGYYLWFLLLLMLTGVPTFFGVWLWRSSSKQICALVYVPPVREQIAALPAEEILVRGSIEPTADPKELLKAASVGIESAKDELLRAEVRVAE